MIWLCSVAPLAAILIPILLPAFQVEHGLDPRNVGLVASADLVGACVATVSAPLWLKHVGARRGALIGLVIFIAANLMTIAAPSPGVLMICRIVAGIGTGAVLSSSIPIVSSARRPARILSGIQLMQLLVAGAALWGAGHLLARGGTDQILLLVAFVAFCSAPACFLLPGRSANPVSARLDLKSLRPCLAVLAGIFVYFASIAMLSNYAGKLGLQQGLSLTLIGSALAIGTLGAIPGSSIAMLAGTRRVVIALLVVASGVQVISIIMFVNSANATFFVAAYFLMQMCITIVAPLQVAILVERDKSGRAIEGLAAMQSVGQAMGPLAASFFISTISVSGAYFLGLVLVILSLGLVTVSRAVPATGRFS